MMMIVLVIAYYNSLSKQENNKTNSIIPANHLTLPLPTYLHCPYHLSPGCWRNEVLSDSSSLAKVGCLTSRRSFMMRARRDGLDDKSHIRAQHRRKWKYAMAKCRAGRFDFSLKEYDMREIIIFLFCVEIVWSSLSGESSTGKMTVVILETSIRGN